jgi:hypothetical protein
MLAAVETAAERVAEDEWVPDAGPPTLEEVSASTEVCANSEVEPGYPVASPRG